MRYVTVDEITGKVINVGQVTSAAQLDEPAVAQRHIVESDWVAGSDPSIGDEWDGQVPTTFTSPSSELDNLSATELLDRQSALRAEAEAVDAALRSRLV